MHAPIQRALATPGVGKVRTPIMKIIFPMKIGSKCQERESRLSVSGSRGYTGLFIKAPGVSPGRLSCIRKGGSATAGIPGRIFLSGLTFLSCPSTQKCRLLSLFLASGVVGLWSMEGCGVGPNLHSIVTSTGASATAGILNRMTPCPALRLYPGLQILVPSTTYRRSTPTPRQVLPPKDFGQLAQVPLLHWSHPTTGCGGHTSAISHICTRILFLTVLGASKRVLSSFQPNERQQEQQ